MKRQIYDELKNWKTDSSRKPLILRGARQVGKTWIMKEFGSHEFKNMAYLNCEKNESAKTLFRDNFDVHRIIRGNQIHKRAIFSGQFVRSCKYGSFFHKQIILKK